MSPRLGVLCGVLALSLGLRGWLSAIPAVPPRAPLSSFPTVLGNWELLREQRVEENLLAVLKADDHLLRTYKSAEGEFVDLYIGYYENQRTGETMHSPKNCFPGWGWRPLASGRISLGVDRGGAPVLVNRYLLEKDGQRALVLYWYQAHGRIIASEYWGKIYLVWDSLWRQRRDGALVRLVIPIKGRPEDAESQAVNFSRVLLPQLSHFLPD